jgi:NCAIR mutase (PurE)-related protein
MELVDAFSKYDNQIESSVKRNEQVYMTTAQEIGQEAKLMIERQMRGGKKEVSTVDEYIKNFKWDSHKFPMDKSLKVIGAKIIAIQKTCDEKLKKQIDD